MLKVVSNTTPIISLLKIGKLPIFKDLYGEIFIPQEVIYKKEARKNKEFHTHLSKIKFQKNLKIDTSTFHFHENDDKKNNQFKNIVAAVIDIKN